MFSIQDELFEFKNKMKEIEVNIIKLEKVGNGNMDAYKMFFNTNTKEEKQECYFWRHDLDNVETKLISKFILSKNP